MRLLGESILVHRQGLLRLGDWKIGAGREDSSGQGGEGGDIGQGAAESDMGTCGKTGVV